MRTRGERDKIRSTRAFCFSFTLTDSGTACVDSSTRQWEACVLSERRNLWIWLMDACFFPFFGGPQVSYDFNCFARNKIFLRFMLLLSLFPLLQTRFNFLRFLCSSLCHSISIIFCVFFHSSSSKQT